MGVLEKKGFQLDYEIKICVKEMPTGWSDVKDT